MTMTEFAIRWAAAFITILIAKGLLSLCGYSIQIRKRDKR